MALVKTTTIRVNEQNYEVAGGDFDDRKEAIKKIGGQWLGYANPPIKAWLIEGKAIEEVGSLLEQEGLELITDDDQIIDKELNIIIKRIQWCNLLKEVMLAKAKQESASAKQYSFNSKSRIKAAHMIDAGCLNHALDYMKKAPEQLTEPEIASLKRAIELAWEFSSSPLEWWIEQWRKDPQKPWLSEDTEPHLVPMPFIDMRAVPTKEFPVIGEQPLLDVFLVDLATKLNTHPDLLPQLSMIEMLDPDNNPIQMMQFQLAQPGDDQ